MKKTRVQPGAASQGGFGSKAGLAYTPPMQNGKLGTRYAPAKRTVGPMGRKRG